MGDVQRSIRVGCDFCDAALLAYLNDTFVHTNITNSLAIKICNCLHPEIPPLVVLMVLVRTKQKTVIVPYNNSLLIFVICLEERQQLLRGVRVVIFCKSYLFYVISINANFK